LVFNANDKNCYLIIIFLQKNKFYSINIKIDEIINEKNEEKKLKLIENLNRDTIDFSSSGYAVQLFSNFNNNEILFIYLFH